MPNLDSGAARIIKGHTRSSRVHAIRPPLGHGLVCDPHIDIERLEATDAPVDCKVCISHMNIRNAKEN